MSQKLTLIFKEITLIDTANGYPVVIDLSETNITQIKGMNIVENDIVYGAITSTVNGFGQTAAWALTRIKKLRQI